MSFLSHLIVQSTIFDINSSKYVESKFYDMCETTGENCAKAEALFEAIDSKFLRDSIDWVNVIAVGFDNTATNMGCNNSIKTRILGKNSDVFIAGCNCQLSHLAASKGADAFSTVTGFDIKDHEVDVYYITSVRVLRGRVCYWNFSMLLTLNGVKSLDM